MVDCKYCWVAPLVAGSINLFYGYRFWNAMRKVFEVSGDILLLAIFKCLGWGKRKWRHCWCILIKKRRKISSSYRFNLRFYPCLIEEFIPVSSPTGDVNQTQAIAGKRIISISQVSCELWNYFLRNLIQIILYIVSSMSVLLSMQ